MDIPIDTGMLSPKQRAALASLFRNTTNSYKFLLFLTLIEEARRNGGIGPLTLKLRDLLGGMLAVAWFPHAVCRLSFGPQDTIERYLDRVQRTHGVPGDSAGIHNGRAACRSWASQYAGSDDDLRTAPVLRYVITRLLRPFFVEETAGVKDWLVDLFIANLSREKFDEVLPLYRVDEGGTSITIHPSWQRALQLEAPVFEGWAAYHWLQYMQQCNPNAPALARKLLPPSERESLQGARELWLTVMGLREVRSPYTGRLLGVDVPFDVDHFVPWSFLVHDAFWNLIPAEPWINTSKGQRLPDTKYIRPVAIEHFHALTALRRHLRPQAFAHLAEGYTVGLSLPTDALVDKAPASLDTFVGQFERMLTPLLSLAASHGFVGPWSHDA